MLHERNQNKRPKVGTAVIAGKLSIHASAASTHGSSVLHALQPDARPAHRHQHPRSLDYPADRGRFDVHSEPVYTQGHLRSVRFSEGARELLLTF
jgi:hypothetical protein